MVSILPWAHLAYAAYAIPRLPRGIDPEGFYFVAGFTGVAAILLTAPLAVACVSLIERPAAPARHTRLFWLMASPAIAYQAFAGSALPPFSFLGPALANIAATVFWIAAYWLVLRVAGWVSAPLRG